MMSKQRGNWILPGGRERQTDPYSLDDSEFQLNSVDKDSLMTALAELAELAGLEVLANVNSKK